MALEWSAKQDWVPGYITKVKLLDDQRRISRHREPANRERVQVADLPYFNPHSVRNTLVRLGEARCKNPDEFKACSQNLGHEAVMTTFTSYGTVSHERQAEIFQPLNSAPEREELNETTYRAFMQALKDAGAVPPSD